MALSKIMRSVNGLPLTYHRISRLEIETNLRVGVYVLSYLSKTERDAEKLGEVVYSEESYYCTDTPEGPMTVAEAYGWLKSERPEFEGAEDVLEDNERSE